MKFNKYHPTFWWNSWLKFHFR